MSSGLQAALLAERPRLLRLLRARLGSAEDAEEAFQDMWLRLQAPTAAPVADPVAYLFRMANNLATDRRIAAARRGRLENAWLETRPGAGEQPSAERSLLARDKLRSVLAVVEAMPERMRAAYTLFRIEELPQRDIATRMGISVSAVEKLLQRAYARLHQLGDQSDDNE